MLCLCYVLLTDIRMENLGNLPSLVDMSAIRKVNRFLSKKIGYIGKFPLNLNEIPAMEMVSNYSEKEKFIFLREFKWNRKIKSFHRLNFNESISINMAHYYYLYSPFNNYLCIIVFSFRDEFENEIIQFSVIPGVAQFRFKCWNRNPEFVTFPRTTFTKLYRIKLVFSNLGVLMFFNDFLYIKSTACINEITKITKLKHTVGGTLRFGAILEVTREEARVPADWQIVKPIPMLHKFIVHYYPNNLSIITIRLTDGNGITALAITVDYELGILYTRRDRLDDGNVQCVNFGNSRLFINKTLAKVEISLLPYQYEVNITSNVNDSRNYRTVNMELLEQNRDISDHQVTVGITSSMGLYSARTSKCIVHGHHLYPYDIQRAIFDSTNKQSVFFAHFIEELNKHF